MPNLICSPDVVPVEDKVNAKAKTAEEQKDCVNTEIVCDRMPAE